MKNSFKLILFIILGLSIKSCGTKLPKGQKILELPCFQDKYTSNKKNYMTSARGISLDQAIARKKAMINAKTEISSLIRTNIRSLTDDYSVSRSVGNVEAVKSRFESITSESVNEILTDVKVACQELAFDKKSGQYNFYVALSISKDQAAQQVIKKLTSKEKKDLDLDYEKFRSLMDKDVPKN